MDDGLLTILTSHNYKNPYSRSTWCKIIKEDVVEIKVKQHRERVDHTREMQFVAENLINHLLDKTIFLILI